MVELSFTQRAEELMKDLVEEAVEKRRYKISQWNRNNPEKLFNSQKKYYQSQKGKAVNARLWKQRSNSIRNAPSDQLQLIQNFYNNCPNGYVVDHIIPISKGGKHELSNLQYLQDNKTVASAITIDGILNMTNDYLIHI